MGMYFNFSEYFADSNANYKIKSRISENSEGFFLSLSLMSLILLIFSYNMGVIIYKNVTHTRKNKTIKKINRSRK